MATVTVDQSKLIMNAFAATFQNNLISKDIVSWKKYDSEMDDRNGLQVVEQVGPRYNVTETTDGVKDLTSGVQDSVFGSEIFKVNKTFGSSMGWGDFVKIRDIGAARESVALKNAATNLAEKIDAYIMGVASKASNNWLGTPANSIATFGDIMQGYTRLKEEGVEDTDLRAILTYGDKEDLGEAVINFHATDALSTGAFRQGFTGAVGGIPTMFTQQLPILTTGTHAGTPLVAGAAQGVNYADVAVSTAPGRYMTQTLTVDGLGASQTVKAGEVFTIAGVNAYDNRMGQTLGRLQQFTVVADATADGTGAVSLVIFPAIIAATGSGANLAHATVTAVPADNAALVFVGSASTDYRPRLLINKESIIVNTADLILPASDTSRRQALSKVPLSVRMWQTSDFATGAHSVRFDVALTANVRDRRRLVRINGV